MTQCTFNFNTKNIFGKKNRFKYWFV